MTNEATPKNAKKINNASPVKTPRAALYPPFTPCFALEVRTKIEFGPGTSVIKITPKRYVQIFEIPILSNI
ncbi:hypothetical protein PROTEUSMB838_03250 [Proteus sp. MB838]